MVKIDLHVHSKYSTRPSQWILKRIGCPESFTEPLQIYKIAKKKGMSLVTVTDHNTIAGAAEIAHLPDTFVSEEITAYFPEDRCKVHILAFNITENHHHDIQKVRENISDLADYLNQEQILHVVAHPLYGINDRFSPEHFERLLLLFKNFELNGARNPEQNRLLRFILSNLTSEDIQRLSEKYNMIPKFPEPWKKNLTGGSDDHSGLNIARTYTEISSANDVQSVLNGIKDNQTKIISADSTPQTMAHNLYGIAYQFYRQKFRLEKYVHKDILLKFLDHSLRGDIEEESGFISKIYSFWNYKKYQKIETDVSDTLMDLIRRETEKMLMENPQLLEITQNSADKSDEQETRWYQFVNQISNQVMFCFANHLLGHLSGADVFDIFHTIGSAGGLYTLLVPYFVSFSQFTRDRNFLQTLLDRFNKALPAESSAPCTLSPETNIAHFTDTFYEVNGVALTLQQQVKLAVKNNKKFTVITSHDEEHTDKEGVKNFKPVGVYELPEYPEQKIYYPPFLEMLNFCYEQNFTHIQSATPGPSGLAALAIARILKLPISGTYHTALPQYAQYLTGDEFIEELTWKYTLWYYDQMDIIYVPSQSSKDELVQKGIHPGKIRLFPRGVNIRRFHPANRNGILEYKYHIREKVKLLYVGRVSKEKNLHILAEVFKSLIRYENDLHLIIVGDGPYLKEMQHIMKGTPCTFTGYLAGDELAALYASSDIFVFPSTTDTFGNVILEAQASGLPVIVTDEGGPHENMIPEKTGFAVRGNDSQSLTRAVQLLIADPKLLKTMGKAARQYMEERSFENAFIQTWEMFDYSPVSVLRRGNEGNLAKAV